MKRLPVILDPAEQFPSLRAKRSNPELQTPPWIATARPRLAMTPGMNQQDSILRYEHGLICDL
jgi:hypothetical protein